MTESQRSAADRVLDLRAKNKMINDLSQYSDWKVKVTAVLGDGEAQVFAEQIKTIFDRAGWSVDGVDLAMFSKPVRKVLLEVSEEPPNPMQQALMPLFDNFENPREAFLNNKLPNKTIAVIVGNK